MPSPNELLAFLDLTRLIEGDSSTEVTQFCQKATTPKGNVAAICVYTEFLSDVVPLLANTGVRIATVCNFPEGNAPIQVVQEKIHDAINLGANEIDLVMPYQALIAGQYQAVYDFVYQAKQRCGQDTLLKVIIESGELTADQIKEASNIVIDAGGDFIKTSTGKTPVGATLDAAKIILTSIQNSNKKVGIKVSGGIRSVAMANRFKELVISHMGAAWLSPNTFRIGASGLLDEILTTDNTTTV